MVIGSWYGGAPVDLGGVFHRSRIRLISSQVSTIAPAHTGRWDKSAGPDVAWSMLLAVDVGALITHRLPLDDAPRPPARNWTGIRPTPCRFSSPTAVA
ncbi:MAG: hypothetical protein R2854_18715 [Caldilineaceae bacterium]